MKTLAIMIGAIIAMLFSITARAEDKNVYSNPTVGLSLVKPDDWQFVTADEFAENLKRTKLSDEEFQKKMEKYATAPLVAMMKHSELFDDLNPSFKVNIKPLGELPAEEPKKILALVTKQFPKIFKDYQLVTAPTETKVSGLAAAYAKIHYSLEIPDGRSFPTCSELWIVPRGSYFFMIGAGTRQDEASGKRSEIRAILDSLKLVEQAEVSGDDLRKEVEAAKEVVLEAPWNDQSKWKMTDYHPPKGLVSKAYEILKAAGYDDLMKEGAIYYSIEKGKHLLLITSTNSTHVLSKYYCLAYDDQSETPLTPVKVWAKYREVIHKFTNAGLDLTQKAED